MDEKRQRKAAQQDESIHYERNKQYLGTARIDLSCLEPVIANDIRAKQFYYEDLKVKRLIRIFALKGCRRLKLEHYMLALISQTELNEALKLSCKTLDDLRSNGFPLKLDFRPLQRLKCLNGRYRLQAAKKLFKGSKGFKGEDWWVVDLYSNG